MGISIKHCNSDSETFHKNMADELALLEEWCLSSFLTNNHHQATIMVNFFKDKNKLADHIHYQLPKNSTVWLSGYHYQDLVLPNLNGKHIITARGDWDIKPNKKASKAYQRQGKFLLSTVTSDFTAHNKDPMLRKAFFHELVSKNVSVSF